MGLETTCRCRWNGGAGDVKVLLEARELILRGDIKHRLPRSEISDARVAGGDLHVESRAGTFIFELGPDRAHRWAAKLLASPPQLADKLGVNSTSKVLTIGPLEDAVLVEALKDATTESGAEARMCLTIARNETALRTALRVHAMLPEHAPIWIVYEKGAKAAFGESAVRSLMRHAGYRDNKVSAISDALSATRYARSR